MRDVFDPLLHCNAKVVHRGSPKQKFSFNNESSVELNFNIFNFYYLSSWFFNRFTTPQSAEGCYRSSCLLGCFSSCEIN